jgi:hypothetical protein
VVVGQNRNHGERKLPEGLPTRQATRSSSPVLFLIFN